MSSKNILLKELLLTYNEGRDIETQRLLSKLETERKANLFSQLTACDFCLPYWVCQKITCCYLAENCSFFVSPLVSKEV
jgi:hypothetical protein